MQPQLPQPRRTRTPSPNPRALATTTRPSPPRFHLHAQAPPPQPKTNPWAAATTAARGALDLDGRVQHIARATHTPPPLLQQPGRVQAKDWAWVCRALTTAKRGQGTRAFLNLPHTVLLAGGGPHGCWAFSSAQRGVVLRKHEAHATDLAHLQSVFLRVTAASPRPRLAVPRPPRRSGAFGSSSSLSLPAALVQAGVEPEAVVALVQGENNTQRPIDALELVQLCQSGAFPPGARTLQAYVPEKGASVALSSASSSSSSGISYTLVPGSTFRHEYTLGRLGAPLYRSSRCVSRSLFGGGGGGHKGDKGRKEGTATSGAGAMAATGGGGGGGEQEEEGVGKEKWEDGEEAAAASGYGRAAPELELLPSTNRALNQAMVDAALQVVMHVESAGGGKVQRLVAEFFLDDRDKLWLRRTLDCQVRVPEKSKARDEAEAAGKSSRGQRRGRRPQEGSDEEESNEEEEEERVLPWLPSPPSMVMPGHRIEERVGRRAARRDVAVDEAEVARILSKMD